MGRFMSLALVDTLELAEMEGENFMTPEEHVKWLKNNLAIVKREVEMIEHDLYEKRRDFEALQLSLKATVQSGRGIRKQD